MGIFLAGGTIFMSGYLAVRLKQKHNLQILLGNNAELFNKKEKKVIAKLVNRGQRHLFEQWPRAGINDAKKRQFVEAALQDSKDIHAFLKKTTQLQIDILKPPKVVQKQHTLEEHGEKREDNHYWLRDDNREDKEVLEYIGLENDYTKAVMGDTVKEQEDLFKELKARIQETDQTTPIRNGQYFYYSRTLEGKQYSIDCRRKMSEWRYKNQVPSEFDEYDENVKEEVMLDQNQEAKGKSYYEVGAFEISPDHRYLAYNEDLTGNERCTIQIKDLNTGKQMLQTPITNTSSCEWLLFSEQADSQVYYLYYTTIDQKFREDKVWRHTFGSSPTDDELIFEEKDPMFYLHLHKSLDQKLIFVHMNSRITSDILYIHVEQPDTFKKPRPTLGRVNDVEYSVYHRNDHFFYKIRDKARPNSEICVAPVSNPTQTTVILDHREDVKIESVVVFQNFLAVYEREKISQSISIYQLPEGGDMPQSLKLYQVVKFDGVYEIYPGSQGEFNSDILRYNYTSLATPIEVIDYNMRTGNKVIKKVDPVLGNFNKNNYETVRLEATSHDGVKVPISLVYNKNIVKIDGTAPCMLEGYGSYGIDEEVFFRKSRVSYLDAGFVCAHAHIRGGGDLGRQWYEDGKYLKKKNTFYDFIACAEKLISDKYCAKDKCCAVGRSAGGLLMGAAMNLRPDLFLTVIAVVPFVDVLTTIMDSSIPLTESEWEEWGNPVTSKEFYDYIKSYSPMDNLQQESDTLQYPNILVSAGLQDQRVAYWEPLKYVAKLRLKKQSDRMLLLKMESEGHFSKSGRFDYLKEVAFEIAFVKKSLRLLELKQQGESSSASDDAKLNIAQEN